MSEIITAGRTSGDVRMDLTDDKSVRAAFERVGPVDAVVSAAGSVKFAPFAEMQAADYEIGLKDKLMGQVNLVLVGRDLVADGGSFTLTSGILNRDPIRGGAAAAAANGALDGFVRGAAVDMPRGIRINTVSPEILEVSRERFKGFFNGHFHVSDAAVGMAYVKSVEGCLTGQVFPVDYG